jgi:putative ABC transport system permease protein
MLKHYLTIARRCLLRHRAYALINIFGLAVGVAACLLIMLYVQNELSFDGFHRNKDHIYRVAEYTKRPDGFQRARASAGTPIGPLLKVEFPEVATAVRFYRQRMLVSRANQRFYEDRFCFADSGFFRVFSFTLAKGDPLTALKEPFSVVITASVARKYFGDADPLGQTLRLDNRVDLTVTGIVDEAPPNSHISFDLIASFETANRLWNEFGGHWESGVWTYLLLAPGVRPDALEAKFREFTTKYRGADAAATTQYRLQPLAGIHLGSHLGGEVSAGTEPSRLYLFAAIAGFILLIACVNFVNLSTAQYTQRAEEVSVRKVFGSTQGQVTRQFLGESAMLVAAAVVLSVALAELFAPVLGKIAGVNLHVDYDDNWLIPVGLVTLWILVTLLAGSYPAIRLAKLDPVTVMNRSGRIGRGSVRLRRLLVGFQFVISIVLIICTLGIHHQFRFMSTRDLGFDGEHVLVVPTESDLLRRSLPAIKSQLLGRPGIAAVSASSNYPGDVQTYGLTLRFGGGAEDMNIAAIWVDPDYLRTLGLDVRRGRDYNAVDGTAEGRAFILNERAQTLLGERATVGQKLFVYAGTPEDISFSYDGTVIGAVEDYHFRDLRNTLRPVILIIDTRRLDYLLIRASEGNLTAAVASARDIMSKCAPERPFEFFFLDDYTAGLYRREQSYATVFAGACLVAIVVALIGLFALAACITRQRTREIGIRKALGASATSIVLLLSREFVILVAAANLIAWPVAYYLLVRWLGDYPYRIRLGADLFLQGAAISLALALLAAGYRSVRSATDSPAETLRHE